MSESCNSQSESDSELSDVDNSQVHTLEELTAACFECGVPVLDKGNTVRKRRSTQENDTHGKRLFVDFTIGHQEENYKEQSQVDLNVTSSDSHERHECAKMSTAVSAESSSSRSIGTTQVDLNRTTTSHQGKGFSYQLTAKGSSTLPLKLAQDDLTCGDKDQEPPLCQSEPSSILAECYQVDLNVLLEEVLPGVSAAYPTNGQVDLTVSANCQPKASINKNPDNIRKDVSPLSTSDRSRKLTTREANKILRMRGEKYVGFSKVINPLTSRRSSPQDVPRNERKLGICCTSIKCFKSKNRYCNSFPEEVRLQIFKEFWSLQWGEKKAYAKSLVDQTVARRCTKKTGERKKNTTFIYNLKLNGVRKQVCKTMFLNTLGIGRNQLQAWVLGNMTTSSGRTTENRIRKGGDMNIARAFLTALPKLPSHYCRKDSKKLYLEQQFRTISQLYNVYKSKCVANNDAPVHYDSFLNLVDKMNIGVHIPKKDRCDTCCSIETGNISKEVYDQHVLKKDSARAEKSKDKAVALDGNAHVITMDTQKVLLSPMLTASTMYYKTKLIVHNFTIFDLASGDVLCNLWNESEAGLTAPVFASCLIAYLESQYQDDLNVIIFSDGCTNQNRNATMSNALLYYAVKNRKTVIQKYLEKGHTQMEVDSVHAKIEQNLTGRSVYLPSDYVSICSNARQEKGGYRVRELGYADFVDYSKNMVVYKSIRPGARKNDPHVTDIRQMKYNPDGTLEYKLNHLDDWKPFPRRYRVDSNVDFPKLYSKRIPIAKRKYEDLQSMLHVLPSSVHEYYKSLPHD